MEINYYNSVNQANNLKQEGKLKVQNDKESLNMQDFLNLLVAQMTNQDAMNPMDNTEFIAQMAQFSSLQAMTSLTEMSVQGQATSLIGKNVVVACYNQNGELEVQEGIVQKVTIHGGKTKLYVNDMEFDYSNVMEVKKEQQVDPIQEKLDGILKEINQINKKLSKEEQTTEITEVNENNDQTDMLAK